MKMSNRVRAISVLVVLVVLTAALATVVSAQESLDIVVSPKVLSLNSKGGSISVHTNLNYGLAEEVVLSVDGESLETGTFADDRGDLVVKADIDDVKSIVSVGEATFVLQVETAVGQLVGTDTIRVVGPAKR